MATQNNANTDSVEMNNFFLNALTLLDVSKAGIVIVKQNYNCKTRQNYESNSDPFFIHTLKP